MTKQIPASQIKPGMTYITHYGPRVVVHVQESVEFGKRWLHWFWSVQPRRDGIDCGYGGVTVDEASSFMVEVAA